MKKYLILFLIMVSAHFSQANFNTLCCEINEEQTGKASWYGDKFHGRKTASGEVYDKMAMTAAHKTLPFGTKVKITNLETNKSVVVTVNDRGPYVKERVFDLSRGAFSEIADINKGVLMISYEIV